MIFKPSLVFSSIAVPMAHTAKLKFVPEKNEDSNLKYGQYEYEPKKNGQFLSFSQQTFTAECIVCARHTCARYIMSLWGSVKLGSNWCNKLDLCI